ncbi:hypothetical protein HY632_01230 [Candidatus Uhrbacteria bacterium]|nr:hypothetical protein [Candidatus Uhrbacteria bacterium]
MRTVRSRIATLGVFAIVACGVFLGHISRANAGDIAFRCDEQVIKERFPGYALWAYPMCAKPNAFYPGDLVVMDAGGFLPDQPNRRVWIGPIYFFRGEPLQFVQKTTPMGPTHLDGNGATTLAFVVPRSSALTPGTYTLAFRVYETCEHCSQPSTFRQGPCPDAECIQPTRVLFAQAYADITILDPKTNPRPSTDYGSGDFQFDCRWKEYPWNATREDWDVVERYHRNASTCASGAEFTIDSGNLKFMNRSWTYHVLFRNLADGKEYNTSVVTGGNRCDRRVGKNGCTNIPAFCTEPKSARSPYDRNCKVENTDYLNLPPGSYQVVFSTRWANTARRQEDWEVAGPTFTMTEAPQREQAQYKGSAFTVTIARDVIKLDSPLVPQYVKPGQFLTDASFDLPMRWNPPKGTSLKFPGHRLAIALDANDRGEGGTVLGEGMVGLNSTSYEPTNQLTWHNLKLPTDTKPGRHRLTVRCLNCDAKLTVGDPAIGNRPRPVSYAPASVDIEVVDLAKLPLPAIQVRPLLVGRQGKVTITGTNYPPNAQVTYVEFRGRNGGPTLSSTFRDPPYGEFVLPVEGQKVTKWIPAITVPVGANGTFALTIPLPAISGDLVDGKGPVRVEVLVRDAKQTFSRTATFTMDATDCPQTESTPKISFGLGRSSAKDPSTPLTAARPLNYARGETPEILGKGFHCRTPITKVTAAWRSRGVNFGPVELPMQRSPQSEPAPFTVHNARMTAHDGSLELALQPTGSLYWRNFHDVEAMTITVTDAKGRTSAAAVLPIAPAYRATLDPDWLRETKRSAAGPFAPGETVRLRLHGFPTGHRLAIHTVPTFYGDEPLDPTKQVEWNAQLRNVLVNVGTKVFVERDPHTLDYRIPMDLDDTKELVFLVADVTDSDIRANYSDMFWTLRHSRPRTTIAIPMTSGPITPPNNVPVPPPPKDDVRTGDRTIMLEPKIAAPGETITIRLVGFDAYSVPTVMVGPTRISKSTSYTDGKGTLVVKYRIPPATANDLVTVTATDTQGRITSAILTVRGTTVAPTLTVYPPSGPAGLALTVRGNGWDASEKAYTLIPAGNGKPRSLTLESDSCIPALGRVACDTDELLVSLRLPEDLEAGTITIRVTSALTTASTKFHVIKKEIPEGITPVISLDPDHGPAGIPVTVIGGHFTPHAGMLIRFNDDKVRVIRGASTTDAQGKFPGAVIAIPNVAPGTYPITVSDGRTGRATAMYEVLGEPITPSPNDVPKVTPPPLEPKPDAPCNPDLPSWWIGACPTKTNPAPLPAPEPKKESSCNPDLPSWWVGACKQVAPEIPKPVEPPPHTPCNPDLPSWWVGACTSSTPAPAPVPTPPPDASKCSPFAPDYTQPPECRSATATPSTHTTRAPSLLAHIVDPLLAILTAPTTVAAANAPAFTPKFMAGSYRCWSYNVSGGGGSCRLAPPIELKANGTYSMSSERGRFTIRSNSLSLSQSKIRGQGTISDDGMRITFAYPYNGWKHTVTYLRSTPLPGSVIVELTIRYPEAQGWLDWVSTVELQPEHGDQKARYDGVATSPDRQTVKTSYARGVLGGMRYRVFVSTGTDRQEVGILDLRSARSGAIKRTINAPLPKPTATKPEPTPAEPNHPSAPLAAPTPEAPSFGILPIAPPVASGTPCNPHIPSYTQPGCIDPNEPPTATPPAAAPATPIFSALPEGPVWKSPEPPPSTTSTDPAPTTTSPTTPRKNTGDAWRDSYENEDTPIRNWYHEHPGAIMGPPLLRYNLPSGIF